MGEHSVLADAPARSAIGQRLDETLFVEAGAGTGKTTALVGRVLELVRSKRTSIGKVAAITFTEAAAADLRSRIHLEMTLASRRPDGEWARGALGELDDASLTTIHGFAQRILAEHPLAARLPLRFNVFDEIEYDFAFDRRFRDVIDDLVADDERGLLVAAALAVDISLSTLSELAAEVDSKWDRFLEIADDEVSLESLAAEVDAVESELAEMIASVLPLRSACDDDEDGLCKQIDKLGEALERRKASKDWIDRLEWCYSIGKISHARTGSKESWRVRPIAEIRDVLRVLDERREAIVTRIVGRLLRSLVVVFEREAVTAAEERRRKGELSFHDLLVFAHQLLCSRPDIANEVSSRFSHILIDEFQDTDPLQLAIVKLLAKDASGEGLEPGKLFFVGDPRQSIYRFRGAEPELYERELNEIAPSGPVVLTSNFRSVLGIVEFVNAVFERMGENRDDSASKYHALSVVRGIEAPGAAVKVCGVQAGGRSSEHDRRVREALDVAELIDRCVLEEWPVEVDGVVRPARYGDVTILVTKRTGLAELEDALDARDIPFRADSPSLILRSAEIRDFLACLRAIDLPGDEAALVGALRTPMLGCGDDDLWRYRRAGGRWSLELARADEPGRVGNALRRLGALADRRHDLGLVQTMHAAAEELKIFEIASTNRHGEESLRRLHYLFARASAFVDAGGDSIADFVDWIDRQAGARVRGVETAIGEPDGAVRILTVHAAKGLEFPIVFLAELAADPARQHVAGRILFGDDDWPEIRIRRGVETPGYAALHEDETERAEEELVRLLYVAMTRARDHLVVSLHRSESGSKQTPSLADRLAELLEHLDGAYVEVGSGVPTSPHEAAIAPQSRGPAATKEAFAAWRARREAVSRASLLPTSVGARAMEAHRYANVEINGHDAEPPSGSERWRRARGATAIGRAVHGVLQRVDLRDRRGVDELVVSETIRNDCVETKDTVRALVDAALSSDELRRAAAATRSWRELPVSVPIADGVLDGVIDLAYEEDERLIVVDYKTDTLLDEEALRRRCAEYRPQAGAYALALASVLGRPIGRFVFLFLRAPGGVRALEVADLEAATSDATEAAERYLATPAR
ncbi:MAG: UvrD-helicase domain-containing protein [Acidimicrobiales bacterium]